MRNYKNVISVITLLMLFVCSPCISKCYAVVSVNKHPSEMLVLELPKNDCTDWKEINRLVAEKEGIVELIPSKQNAANWSQLIAIQYYDKSAMNPKTTKSIAASVKAIRDTTIAAYPGNKVTWNIIEKNENDIIYEWILHNAYKNSPPQHEISRAFMTKKGFHRIGLTCKHREMTKDERENWLRSLRDSVSIKSNEEGKKTPYSLSIADKVKDSLDLGKHFKDWQIVSVDTFDSGASIIVRFPVLDEGEIVRDCLTITTMPNINDFTVDKLFDVEKQIISKKTDGNVKFNILNKSPTEIIYSFVHPLDNHYITGIVRTFILNHWYYSLSCKCGYPTELKNEEIQQWKECLETIKPTISS